MKAKEMFEELGYSLDDNPNFYKRPSEPYIKASYIVGGLVHRERNMIQFYDDETYRVTCDVSLELHEAIIQQMKELGWIE